MGGNPFGFDYGNANSLADENPSVYDSPDPGATSSGMAGNSGAVTGAGIGAGLGLLSAIGQQNAYKNAANAKVTQTRFSPWTKMGMGQLPQAPNEIGTIMGTAAGGAAQGQALAGGSMLPMMMMAGA